MELQSSRVELRIFVTECGEIVTLGSETRVESGARAIFAAHFPANRGADFCAQMASRVENRRKRCDNTCVTASRCRVFEMRMRRGLVVVARSMPSAS
jgi:hypothetical protein